MRKRDGRRFLRRTPVAWLPVLCLLAVTLASPLSSEASRAGTLHVSPGNFVGGQMLTFTGKLPATGQPQRIHLEFHMNRASDEWTPIEGSGAMTDARGNFSFRHPARSMRNIRLRVASARSVTDPVTLRAQLREITLDVDPGDARLEDTARARWARFSAYVRYPAVEDEQFTVTVDTAPEGLPAFSGIGITLQQRVSGQWRNVASGTGDSYGVTQFDLTVGDPGTVVYRAVTSRYTQGGERLPWFPSFPTYVDVFHRPAPTDGLAVTGATTDSLDLTWSLPVGEAVDRVLVAWNEGATAPSHPHDADGQIARPAGATSYQVGDLDHTSTYSFTVFVQSPDGVISRAAAGSSVTGSTLPGSEQEVP